MIVRCDGKSGSRELARELPFTPHSEHTHIVQQVGGCLGEPRSESATSESALQKYVWVCIYHTDLEAGASCAAPLSYRVVEGGPTRSRPGLRNPRKHCCSSFFLFAAGAVFHFQGNDDAELGRRRRGQGEAKAWEGG